MEQSRYLPISVAQMVEVDRLTTHDYAIDLVQMMENAGRSLGEIVRRLLGGRTARRRVLVLVGTGNNGGGGMVAARHLANAGADVTLALVSSPNHLGPVPEHQRQILDKMGLKGSDKPTSRSALTDLLSGAEVIVDALIGYGLRGAPRDEVAPFITAANASRAPKVSLDIPSGLNGDTGVAYEPCIRAAATLTLAWPKAGLLKPAAQAFGGDLYLADIGVPVSVYRAVGVDPGDVFPEGEIVRIVPTGDEWQPVSAAPRR